MTKPSSWVCKNALSGRSTRHGRLGLTTSFPHTMDIAINSQPRTSKRAPRSTVVRSALKCVRNAITLRCVAFSKDAVKAVGLLICGAHDIVINKFGGLAHMVERSLSMREVAGSIPASSMLMKY